MESTHSMRWRERRARFVQDDRPFVRRGDLSVDVSSKAVLSGWLAAHHYIKSWPAALLPIGIFGNGPGGRSRLVGAIVFGTPTSEFSGPKRTGLSNPRQSCDLSRLCLSDEFGANGETAAMAQAFRLLRQVRPEIESVVAYSDPNIRRNADGEVLAGGHIGQIYGATSLPRTGLARYTGRTSPRWEYRTCDGQVFSQRAVSKLRAVSQGFQYSIDRLVGLGAPPPGEQHPGAWFDAVVRDGSLIQRFRSVGCHSYVFPFTERAAAAVDPLQIWPRPRLDPNPQGNDVTAPPLFSEPRRSA